MSTVYRESEFVAEVVWVGVSAVGGSLRSGALEALELGFSGIGGARHEGENRPACVRVRDLHAEGTEIRNVRQLTILSEEELTAIGAEIGVAELDPGLLGANVVVKGVPDFTHVPPSTRLQGPSLVTLTVDMENLPCVLPGREIEAEEPGHGKAFKRASEGRRGVTAWVERPGVLSVGDRLALWLPAQRGWAVSAS